LMPTVVIWVQL